MIQLVNASKSSRNMDRSRYCLFCLKPQRNSRRSEISQNWRATSSGSTSAGSGLQAQGDGGCISLEKEVETIFIVRKLLSVQENVCHSMLETFGNPSSWLNVCLECEKVVKKASDIHSKIVFLEKSLEVLRTTTKERIHESESRRRNHLKIKEATLRIRGVVLKDNCDGRHRGDIADAVTTDIKDEPTAEEAHWSNGENEELSDFSPDSEVSLEVETPPSQNHNRLKRPRCSRRFTAKSRLRHHKSVHRRRTVTKKCTRKITQPKNEEDGNEIIKCPLCHYSTNRRSTLSRHLKTYHWIKLGNEETTEHVKLTEWKCTQNQCTQVFNDNEKLTAHCVAVHKMATCPICAGLFPSDILVQYHIARQHDDPKTGKQILKCHRCDYTSTTLHCFVRHRETVHREHLSFYRKRKSKKSSKRCNQCRKVFENINAFKQHCISDHQMISCKKCPRLLMPHQIKNHEYIKHGIGETQTECRTILDKSGNQLYKCRHCTYSSNQERDVRIHQRYFHWEIVPDDVAVRKAGGYKCDKCNADYGSNQALCDHKIEVHGFVQCDKCSKLYLSAGYLEMHRDRYHNEETPFIRQLETRRKSSSGVIKCKICLEVFKSQALLKTHQLETHIEDMFACDNCDEVFVSLRILYSHKVVIHKEQKNPYKCPLCNYTNMQFREIERHKQAVHEKTKKFLCEICSSSFSSEKYLLFHMVRNHGQNADSGRNKMSCDICNKSFSTPWYLKSHIKTAHHNQWIYKCEECGKGFRCQKMVDTHFNSVHRKLLPYECTAEGCNKKFGTNSSLKSHIRFMHIDGKLVQCSYCEKEFKTNQGRKRHEEIHKNEKTKPYQCHKCGKGFVSWGYLSIHFKSHIKAEELDPEEFQQLLLAHKNRSRSCTSRTANVGVPQ